MTSVKLVFMRMLYSSALIILAPLFINAFAQTPARLPRIDPAAYLPPRKPGPAITVSLANVSLTGRTAPDSLERLQGIRETASEVNDLGLLINAANKELTALGGGTISIEGGGSIKTQVQLDHHTKFDSSTYSCDVEGITDVGCFLIGDNVLVEGTYSPPQALLEYFRKGKGSNHRDSFLLAVQSLTSQQLAGTGTIILEP